MRPSAAIRPDFFAAFDDFRGYVDFWLLQDMVTEDYAAVRFFMPFDEFRPPSIPQDVDSYREYCQRSIICHGYAQEVLRLLTVQG